MNSILLNFGKTLFFVAGFTCLLKAQRPVSHDSLVQVWENTANDTLSRLDAVYQLCYSDISDTRNIDRQVIWAREGLDLALEFGAKNLYCRFYNILAAYENDWPNYLKEKTYLSKAREFGRIAKNKKDYVEALVNYIDYEGRPFVPIRFNSIVASILAEEDLTILEAEEIRMLYYSIGNIYKREENYPRAMKWYRNVIDASANDSIADMSLMYTFLNMGNIFVQLNQRGKGEELLKRALKIAKRINNPKLLHDVYFELSLSKQKRENYTSALAYIDSAMMVKPICYCLLLNEINLNQKGNILNGLGKYREALEILLPLKEAFDKNYLGYKYYYGLSNTYYSLGHYNKAISIINQYVDKPSIPIDEKKDLYEIQAKAYEAIQLPKNALKAYKEFQLLRDSIIRIQNTGEVLRLEIVHNFEQKRIEDSLNVVQDNLIKELKYQKTIFRQKIAGNIAMGIGIAAILFVIALFSRLQFIRKTERILKEKNKIIEKEKENAKASEKAKQQFLANMSHEIRTPMNAIKGMTDILLRRDILPEQKNYLHAIKESSDSLLVIINDILDISKVEAGKIQFESIPFSISGVIENVIAVLHFKAEEKGLELVKDITPQTDDHLIGDPTRLHQILLNLTGNAIKFSEKGFVTISASSKYISDMNVLLTFCVTDTGVGIEKNLQNSVFNSFEQAHTDTTRKFGGTGLGLSISKKLVELQHGKIWVESEPGKGSQFYFSIPYEINDRENQQIEKIPEKLEVHEINNLKGVRILLAEDNAFNAIVAQESLEDAIEDLELVIAQNGKIAFDLVNNEHFDIILMDIQMPLMDGYETTEKIRKIENDKASIPIIAMTANVMKDEINRCYSVGMNDFIGKPFDVDELVEKIGKLVLKANN